MQAMNTAQKTMIKNMSTDSINAMMDLLGNKNQSYIGRTIPTSTEKAWMAIDSGKVSVVVTQLGM